METTFIAPAIECGGCIASIQKASGRLKGVHSVAVDLPSKVVSVTFNEAQSSRETLAQALTDIGFPPEKVS
jgi:copper chaperone CopZ